METIHRSLSDTIHAKCYPNYCTSLLHYGHISHDNLQKTTKPTSRFHRSFSRIELASHALFRCKTRQIQNHAISSHVHCKSLLQLVLHGLWYLHSRTTHMGRTTR